MKMHTQPIGRHWIYELEYSAKTMWTRPVAIKNLGLVLQNPGQADEALLLHHKALENLERFLGDHPDTAQS